MNLRTILFVGLASTIVTPAVAAEVNAVASFSIIGDMVQRVGGARVAVTTIVGPNADGHVYEPKPSDAAAVGAADIFFVNGLGFEGWMERLVEATDYAGPLVTVSAGVTAHEMTGEEEHHEEGHDDHDHGAIDPHAWQSLANGLIYVDNIAAGLCGVDAAGCESYKANAVSYKAEMSSLDTTIKSEIAAIPEAKRKVITSHDAFGYFGAVYGVTFMAPEGTSTESEASAKDIAALIEQISAQDVSVLFMENMTDPRLLLQIAQETGAVIGGELYADALSTPDGPAADYLSMFRYNSQQLIASMRESR